MASMKMMLMAAVALFPQGGVAEGQTRLLGRPKKVDCQLSFWSKWEHVPHCVKFTKNGSEKWCTMTRSRTVDKEAMPGGKECSEYKLLDARRCGDHDLQCEAIKILVEDIQTLAENLGDAHVELADCGKPAVCKRAGFNVDINDVPWWSSRGDATPVKAWTAKELVRAGGGLYEAQWWTTSRPGADNVGAVGAHGKEWQCICKWKADGHAFCPGA